MHAHASQQTAGRRKGSARAFAVALLASALLSTAGCAHVDAMFATPKESEPKLAPPKPAPAKAVVRVTPEQRAEAKALHATALKQMSRGAVGPAASNLALAAKLDPANEQIRRDLVRANRMRAASVNSTAFD